MSEKETKKLMEFIEQYKKFLSADVYESDKEVAEVIKSVPNDRESLERYKSYGFAVKKA